MCDFISNDLILQLLFLHTVNCKYDESQQHIITVTICEEIHAANVKAHLNISPKTTASL